MSTPEVAVVGGGLAGLTAAAYLARSGVAVTLFEGAHNVGGRAASQQIDGFSFNLGSHALYKRAAGRAVLSELGVTVSGHQPPNGGYALRRGQFYQLPAHATAVLRTHLLSVRGKIEFTRVLTSLARIDAQSLNGLSVNEWLERDVRRAEVRAAIVAFIRLTSYVNAPALQSAGAAVEQLRLATGGVEYLDGGWQTLADGLRAAAIRAGATIQTGALVESVEHDTSVRALRLRDGARLPIRAAVLAAPPPDVAALVAGAAAAPLRERLARAVPSRTACLDVALTHLPNPRRRFVVGIDQPLYFSVISATARVAPHGAALIQTMKYLPAAAPADPARDEQELEALLDLAQPGWRDALVHRRFLPKLTAVSAIDPAAAGGLPGRPGPAVPEVSGLFLAGDWVGHQGMLADAALTSGRSAAQATLQALRTAPWREPSSAGRIAEPAVADRIR